MFVYLTKKISIPNNVRLRSLAWSCNDAFIAAGGDEGLLKVFRLQPGSSSNPSKEARGTAAITNLSVNQSLEGHSGQVQVAAWNEVYQKLTTSDSNGLIIVWMLYKGSWYEEMINNRNKSSVTDMGWSPDGTKIAIVYEDGVVIVGSVDGNRLWNKEVQGNIIKIEWNGDSTALLFGMVDGEIQAYDFNGNFLQKLHMACLENVELETALQKDLRKDKIVAMHWYTPIPEKKDQLPPPPDIAGSAAAANRETISPTPPVHVFRGQVPPDRPRFAVAYQHGVVQLMRHENDSNPLIVRLEKMALCTARWCPDGSMIAVAGFQQDSTEGEKILILFIGAYGERLRTLKVGGVELAGCAWEGSGLRLCIAIDSGLFFAAIRPDYKWGYCGQTVVYSYERSNGETCVVFFDVKLEETYTKSLHRLYAIASFDDYCVLVNKANDPGGMFLLQLCNGIGTPIDFKYVDIEPKYVTMNANEVLIASTDSFFLWRYVVPRKTLVDFGKVNVPPPSAPKLERSDTIYHIDEAHNKPRGITDETFPVEIGNRRHVLRTSDQITAVCITDDFFLMCRESGTVQRYQLYPEVRLMCRYVIGQRCDRCEINADGSRLAVINSLGILRLFDLGETNAQLVAGFELRDVWNCKWDREKPDLLAAMEKTRMHILRGLQAEDPVHNSGYICCFRDLTVRTALIDTLIKDPDNPEKSAIVDVEIKMLRDAKQLLQKMKIQEATAFIEKNSHPRLWSLLAEVALSRLDTVTAEHAFVMLKDYAGIQFLKKVNNIKSDQLKNAEIAAFYGRLDEAEKIYMDNDRRDLAIAMRRRMNDWFRILQILQTSTGPGDDKLLQETWKNVGDYYVERQKWQMAARHYEHGQHYEQLVRCYLMQDDYTKMEQLEKLLPDGHQLLKLLGEVFGSAGLCEQAVQCYLRCELMNEALDVCIQLNQWERAVQLSKTHHLRDIDALLGKYAAQLTGSSEKTLAAVQLYRKAGRFIDAARIVFDIADEERKKQAQPLRLKKLYVLGALLIEQYHDQNKEQTTGDGEVAREADAALKGLLNEDNALSLADSKLIDRAWRGAEAYHFFMLAQRQLYEGNFDGAMKTALHLTDYDDIIGAMEVYSLLALSSCAAKQFSVCSRAFIKLECIPDMAAEEKDAYNNNAPIDTRPAKAECTGCDATVDDHCQICPSCDTKFPTCIVTGRPLMDYQFWLCPCCKHRAYEQEVASQKHCPLCHVEI